MSPPRKIENYTDRQLLDEVVNWTYILATHDAIDKAMPAQAAADLENAVKKAKVDARRAMHLAKEELLKRLAKTSGEG